MLLLNNQKHNEIKSTSGRSHALSDISNEEQLQWESNDTCQVNILGILDAVYSA